MVVASLVEGRVRIRDDGLKQGRAAARVRDALLSHPGVTDVEANPRVGSLLVLYSAAVTAVEKILRQISDLLRSGEETGGGAAPAQGFGPMPLLKRVSLSIPPGVRRRFLNLGMLATLLLTLAAALFTLKKLHILTGLLFVALVGDHIYQKRGKLLA